jgi:hypothetical protein
MSQDGYDDFSVGSNSPRSVSDISSNEYNNPQQQEIQQNNNLQEQQAPQQHNNRASWHNGLPGLVILPERHTADTQRQTALNTIMAPGSNSPTHLFIEYPASYPHQNGVGNIDVTQQLNELYESYHRNPAQVDHQLTQNVESILSIIQDGDAHPNIPHLTAEAIRRGVRVVPVDSREAVTNNALTADGFRNRNAIMARTINEVHRHNPNMRGLFVVGENHVNNEHFRGQGVRPVQAHLQDNLFVRIQEAPQQQQNQGPQQLGHGAIDSATGRRVEVRRQETINERASAQNFARSVQNALQTQGTAATTYNNTPYNVQQNINGQKR